ncbi:MAG: hypothetical protein AB7G11_11025 [Phycisphaerales bacterium]
MLVVFMLMVFYSAAMLVLFWTHAALRDFFIELAFSHPGYELAIVLLSLVAFLVIGVGGTAASLIVGDWLVRSLS